MKDMHAKPKDHLWVLVVIAAACGLEVCATWTGIGARSGFPVIRFPFGIPGEIPTDFCLMVCMEAYAYYALAIWLTRPGRRSGPFAMWSAIGAMALSLTGQVADHVTSASAIPPRWLVGFVSALPVLALFLGAILAHFVRTDRGETEAAEREAAEARKRAAEEAVAADERTVLRAELAAALADLEAAASDREALRSDLAGQLESAQADLAGALTRAEKLDAKVAALSAKKDGLKPRKHNSETAHAGDITTEFRAWELLRDDPKLRQPRMGAELGRKLGASEATGRRLHSRLIVDGQLRQPLTEPLTDQSGERS